MKNLDSTKIGCKKIGPKRKHVSNDPLLQKNISSGPQTTKTVRFQNSNRLAKVWTKWLGKKVRAIVTPCLNLSVFCVKARPRNLSKMYQEELNRSHGSIGLLGVYLSKNLQCKVIKVALKHLSHGNKTTDRRKKLSLCAEFAQT